MAVKVDRRVILAALLGAWSPSPARPIGNIIYMATNGNDANAGTIDAPVATLTRLAEVMQPGETGYVRGGIYGGSTHVIHPQYAGTTTARKTIMPYPGETVIFDGTNSIDDGSFIDIKASYVTVKGFTIRNSRFVGVRIVDCFYTELRNCIIHDCQNNGVIVKGLDGPRLRSHHITVEGCEVYNNVKSNSVPHASRVSWGQAISFANGGQHTAGYNYIHNNWGEGLSVINSKNCLFQNNHIRDNYSVQCYLDNAEGATVTGNRIWHTYLRDFERTYNKGVTYHPGHGCKVCNEPYPDIDGYRQWLPSNNITVTGNFFGGVGVPSYSSYGLNTGLRNSTITPNTIYNTPEPVRDMTPAWSRPTT